jgi:hypothetical protein
MRSAPVSGKPLGVTMTQPTTKCRRCNQVIEVDPALSVNVLEGMHWLCFHLEFEHAGTDPDRPCTDFTSCPWWTIRHYADRLRELGVDPDSVIRDAIARHVAERS